jgi:hypothetical protein
MCLWNHTPTLETVATPEVGTRALCFHRELGLDSGQLLRILDIAREWREQYLEVAERVVQLGLEIDKELLRRPVERARVEDLISRRCELILNLEMAFVETWIALQQVVTDEQEAKLHTIYRREFTDIPHPVLGSSALQPPLRELTTAG